MYTYHILLLGRDYGPKCDVTPAGLHSELVLFVCRSATFFSMFFGCLRNEMQHSELSCTTFWIFWTVVDIEHEVHLTESPILGLRTSGVVLRLHSLLALDRPRNHHAT